MKKQIIPALVLGALFATTVCVASTLTQTGKLSYTMGFQSGKAMKTKHIKINADEFSRGLRDGYTGQTPALSASEMKATLSQFHNKMVKKMQKDYQQAGEKNLAEGKTFMEKISKEPGVVTLPSGLAYKIIQAGSGNSPKPTDTVTVNYEGSLINGKVFDSSYKRGQPATFKANQVIQGWQEALPLMKPDATWMLYIPANLAYGRQGSMGSIGPNETLIFKVHLISVA